VQKNAITPVIIFDLFLHCYNYADPFMCLGEQSEAKFSEEDTQKWVTCFHAYGKYKFFPYHMP
jgi:hypothetical protein